MSFKNSEKQRTQALKNTIISTKTNKALTQTLLEKGVLFFDNRHLCEGYKQPIVHCFNSHRIGHWKRKFHSTFTEEKLEFGAVTLKKKTIWNLV